MREGGVGVGAPHSPKLHDLRHTFAANTLVKWYLQGANEPARTPHLSTYLGHRDPGFTYWYLSAASGFWPLPPIASGMPLPAAKKTNHEHDRTDRTVVLHRPDGQAAPGKFTH